LTHGVVQSMFLVKLKTAAVAVLASCAIGFGVWASAGAGDGPGTGPGDNPAGNGAAPRPGEAKGDEKPAAKPNPELEKLIGYWWVLSKGERGKAEAIDANQANDPRLFVFGITDLNGGLFVPPSPHPLNGWKGWGNATITLDPTTTPKRIDLAGE